MSASNVRVWDRLLEAGLVQPPEPAAGVVESPWFVKVLLAFCGWFASLFLLGFVGLGYLFVMEQAVGSLITGAGMIGAAYMLLRVPKNEFMEHLGLAISLAGQVLVVWGLIRLQGDNIFEIPWLAIAIVQVPLAMLMPNNVHRVFSSFWAAVAFTMYLTKIGLPYLSGGLVLAGAAWLWLNEFRFPQRIRAVQTIGYGLVLALVPVGGSALFDARTSGWLGEGAEPVAMVQPWMGEVLAAVVALHVIWRLLARTHAQERREGQTLPSRTVIVAMTGTLIFCAVSLEAHGIIVAVVIMLLGFAGGNRVLLGLGIASLLFYISAYYYTLDQTLLAKAQTLLIVGVVLLLVRGLMGWVLPAGQGRDHV